MKIAILYSGVFRTLAETIKQNLKCFDYCDIDLYFSLWDNVGYSNNINSPDFLFSKRTIHPDTIITEDLIKQIAPSHVNIKSIKIEKQNLDNYKFELINGLDHKQLSAQFYKVLDCYNLLDTTVHYDAIIRLRTDLFLNNKISKEQLDLNKITFANKIWYNHPWNNTIEDINDMMWISNKELMQKACNIYNNVGKINEIIKNSNKTNKNFGESICYMNLKAEGIVDKISAFDFDYNILR